MKPLLSITSRIFNFCISSLNKKSELYLETVRICVHKKKYGKNGFFVLGKIFLCQGKVEDIFFIYCVSTLKIHCEVGVNTLPMMVVTETSQGMVAPTSSFIKNKRSWCNYTL